MPCESAWTPGEVLGLIIGTLFALHWFGVFDLVEQFAHRKRGE